MDHNLFQKKDIKNHNKNRRQRNPLRLLWFAIFLLVFLAGIFYFKLNISKKNVTLMVGHRGYSSKYTENTPEAFRQAFKQGFDGIELDVYKDAEGELLVFHDVSLLRMTGENEIIWNLTEETRDKYLIQTDPESKPQKIPTLKEVLKLCSGYSGKILIHLKDEKDLGYEVDDSCVGQIEELVKEYDLSDRVIVFSGRRVIKNFVGRYDLEFGLLTGKEAFAQISELAKWAQEYDIHTILFLYMSTLDFYPEDKVYELTSRGIQAGMYTVETKEDFEKLEKYGFRYAITDYKWR